MSRPAHAPTCIVAWTVEVSDNHYRHYVVMADDDQEPMGVCHSFSNASDALVFAEEMGRKLGLEVIIDDLNWN